jgi:hypothetical protein
MHESLMTSPAVPGRARHPETETPPAPMAPGAFALDPSRSVIVAVAVVAAHAVRVA